jgi:hypothetical protein
MFGTVILLSTSSEAKQIQQHRPICLLKVGFKMFTKLAATIRIMKFTQKVVRPAETVLLPSRNIMEGAIVLRETIYELHKKNLMGFFFKN